MSDINNLQRIDLNVPQIGYNIHALRDIKQKNPWQQIDNFIVKDNYLKMRYGFKDVDVFYPEKLFFDNEEREIIEFKECNLNQKIYCFLEKYRVNLLIKNHYYVKNPNIITLIIENPELFKKCFENCKEQIFTINSIHSKQKSSIQFIEVIGNTVNITLKGITNIEKSKNILISSFVLTILTVKKEREGVEKTSYYQVDNGLEVYLKQHNNVLLFGSKSNPLRVFNGTDLIETHQSFDYFMTEKHQTISIPKGGEERLLTLTYQKSDGSSFFQSIIDEYKKGKFLDKISIYHTIDNETRKTKCKILTLDKDGDSLVFSLLWTEQEPKDPKLKMHFTPPTFKDIFSARNYLIGVLPNEKNTVAFCRQINNTFSWYSQTDLHLELLNINPFFEDDELFTIEGTRENIVFFGSKSSQIWSGYNLYLDSDKNLSYIKTVNVGVVNTNCVIKNTLGIFLISHDGLFCLSHSPDNPQEINLSKIFEYNWPFRYPNKPIIDMIDEKVILFNFNTNDTQKEYVCLSYESNKILGITRFLFPRDSVLFAFDKAALLIHRQDNKYCFKQYDFRKYFDVNKGDISYNFTMYLPLKNHWKNSFVSVDFLINETNEKFNEKFNIKIKDLKKGYIYQKEFNLSTNNYYKENKYIMPFYMKEGSLSFEITPQEERETEVYFKSISLYGKGGGVR